MKIGKKQKQMIHNILFLIALVICIYCIIIFVKYMQDYTKNKNEYSKELNNKIESKMDKETSDDSISNEEVEAFAKVKEYKKQNQEVIGYIRINGTNINYPLLQGKDNKYYLEHNYKKEKSKYGSIYLKNTSDIDNIYSNNIIYGHNMQDGQMFSDLVKYKNKRFYDDHSEIEIYLEDEKRTYKIFSVFLSKVFYKDEKDVFRYYNYINLEDKNIYDEYIKKCKEEELYNTNIIPEYGKQIITLITCEYSKANGRIVVLAQRK